MAFRERYSATIAIAHKIIWSMPPSSSLPTILLLHSCHLLLLLTEETGPSGVVSLDHHIDRLVLPGLVLETRETASNAGLDAATCGARR